MSIAGRAACDTLSLRPTRATTPSSTASATANVSAYPPFFTGGVLARRDRERRCEFDERTNAEAGATLGDVVVIGRRACRPRDVEVRPRHLARELLQEQARSQRAAVATGADVAQVGDLGVEHLAVLHRQRQ